MRASRACWLGDDEVQHLANKIIGNLAGAVFVGFMLDFADVIGPLEGERLAEIAAEKMRFQEMGLEG